MPSGPSEKMGNEHPGERWLLLDHADNSRFFQAHDDGVRHRRDRRYALRLPGKTSFTEEIVRSKHCDDCFLALLRSDGDLHLAALDVEDRIRRISCEKTIWSLWYPSMLRPSPTLARKDFGSNDGRRLIAMTRPSVARVTEKRTSIIIRFVAAKAAPRAILNRSSLSSLRHELCDQRKS